MECFYLDNLASSTTTRADFASLTQLVPPPPPSVVDKQALINWREDGATSHYFVSLAEGTTASLRVQDKGQNRPWVLHGVYVDYDQTLPLADAIRLIGKNQSPDFPVTWVGPSFSGGVHAVWEFEKPVNLVNHRMTEGFLKTFFAHARASRVCGGFDTASHHLRMYYTLMPGWVNTGAVVKESMLEWLLYEVGRNQKTYEDEGVSLPWDVIADEINKRWPGAWSGPIRQGSRGPRFWDPTSTNRTAACLMDTGVAYFTDGGGFLPWGSPTLFGPSFVKQYHAGRIGTAIKNTYYDGRNFYRMVNDRWLVDNSGVVANQLAVRGGLSKAPASKGLPSEVDEAMAHITTNQRVAGAVPFLYRPEKIIYRDGKPYINMSEAECCEMADSPQRWGVNFPFISSWLKNFFADNHQFRGYLSWLHWCYRNAYDGNPRKGQSLIVVGKVNVGKTLMTHRLLSWMLGGHTDISQFLTGRDMFNENLFTKGLACVDDEQASASHKDHLLFSSLLKKITANQDLSMRAMYRGPQDVTWLGRVTVTMNADAESMQMLPNLDINIRDKLLVFRTSDNPWTFPRDVEDVLRREIPFFARYVYDWVIPPEWQGDGRYGVVSFIDPELLSESEFNAPEHAILELVEVWRNSYFTSLPNATEWFGSVTELLRELSREFQNENKVLEGVNTYTLARRLKTVSAKYPWVFYDERAGKQGYVILKQ